MLVSTHCLLTGVCQRNHNNFEKDILPFHFIPSSVKRYHRVEICQSGQPRDCSVSKGKLYNLQDMILVLHNFYFPPSFLLDLNGLIVNSAGRIFISSAVDSLRRLLPLG